MHQIVERIAIFQRKRGARNSTRISPGYRTSERFFIKMCAPEHATGTMGAPALMAITTAPFLNFCNRPSSLRVGKRRFAKILFR